MSALASVSALVLVLVLASVLVLVLDSRLVEAYGACLALEDGGLC